MRDPHRHQHGHANQAELNSDGKNLIVRIGGEYGRSARFTHGRLAELFRDRTSAMTNDWRRFDECERLSQKLKMQAGRIGGVARAILLKLLYRRHQSLVQVGRTEPNRDTNGGTK